MVRSVHVWLHDLTGRLLSPLLAVQCHRDKHVWLQSVLRRLSTRQARLVADCDWKSIVTRPCGSMILTGRLAY